MPDRLTIDLPWPHRALHPNARIHWGAKSKHTKKARSDAAILARAAGAHSLRADRLNVTVTIMPPDARRRDVDGASRHLWTASLMRRALMTATSTSRSAVATLFPMAWCVST
jgi:hypothetical protein